MKKVKRKSLLYNYVSGCCGRGGTGSRLKKLVIKSRRKNTHSDTYTHRQMTKKQLRKREEKRNEKSWNCVDI